MAFLIPRGIRNQDPSDRINGRSRRSPIQIRMATLLFSFRPFLTSGASNPKPSSISMSSPPRSPARPPPPPPPPPNAQECETCACDNRARSRCESCGAQPPWPCARCTFCNPGGSALCDAARPVVVEAEDDPAGPTPLHLHARKRERKASPDVVEVCADEGDGADGGDRAPAAKKGWFRVLYIYGSKDWNFFCSCLRLLGFLF